MTSHVLPVRLEGEGGRVAAELERRIVSGEVPSGSSLNQSRIASELGVSRITVRDALQAVASTGLVVLNGRSGAAVAPMSIEDLEEIFEIRHNLEPLAARLGVPNLQRSDLVRMEQAIAAMVDTPSTPHLLVHHASFHGIIYDRTARPRLIALVRTLRVLMERYFAQALSGPGPSTIDVAQEHEQLFDAARRRDADAAARLTAEHIAGSHDRLVRALLDQSRTPTFEMT